MCSTMIEDFMLRSKEIHILISTLEIAKVRNRGHAPPLKLRNEFRQLIALPSIFVFVFHLTDQLSGD